MDKLMWEINLVGVDWKWWIETVIASEARQSHDAACNHDRNSSGTDCFSRASFAMTYTWADCFSPSLWSLLRNDDSFCNSNNLKTKSLLKQVTVRYRYKNGEQAGRRRIDCEHIYQDFHTNIAQQQRAHPHNKIPKNLNFPREVWSFKSYKSVEQKSRGKSDGEHKKQRSNMRTKHKKIQIHIQLVENKIVKKKIQTKVKNQIAAPTNCISIGL